MEVYASYYMSAVKLCRQLGHLGIVRHWGNPVKLGHFGRCGGPSSLFHIFVLHHLYSLYPPLITYANFLRFFSKFSNFTVRWSDGV